VRCRAGLRQETDVSEDSATSIFGVMSTWIFEARFEKYQVKEIAHKD
jgi:hypothetical protein